ncbi:hypothetical protein ADU60_02480 [Vibrio coralliilyticus]|nr:hypothetical protein DVV14_05320 [Vibrio coralliilyticus]KPH27149.1 hypothetical protein ADU60_02480 [Vibrio coralliilyticus]
MIFKCIQNKQFSGQNLITIASFKSLKANYFLPFLRFLPNTAIVTSCKKLIELHKNNDRVHTLVATSAINQLLLVKRAIVPMKTAGDWLFTKF